MKKLFFVFLLGFTSVFAYADCGCRNQGFNEEFEAQFEDGENSDDDENSDKESQGSEFSVVKNEIVYKKSEFDPISTGEDLQEMSEFQSLMLGSVMIFGIYQFGGLFYHYLNRPLNRLGLLSVGALSVFLMSLSPIIICQCTGKPQLSLCPMKVMKVTMGISLLLTAYFLWPEN